MEPISTPVPPAPKSSFINDHIKLLQKQVEEMSTIIVQLQKRKEETLAILAEEERCYGLARVAEENDAFLRKAKRL